MSLHRVSVAITPEEGGLNPGTMNQSTEMLQNLTAAASATTLEVLGSNTKISADSE